MVIWAAAPEQGRVLARVLRADGGRIECRAGPDAEPALVPLGDAAPLPGEGVRAFMLERRCVDAIRIDAAGGGVLGWLAYPACR